MSEINKNVSWKDLSILIGGKEYPISEISYESKRISIPLTKEEIIELDKVSKIAGSRELVDIEPIKHRLNKKYKGKNSLLIHLNKFL